MTIKRRKYILGRHFGYPECCIEEFGSVKNTGRKLNGTGFVPCVACDEKKTSEELINEINERRKHALPFPHSNFKICLAELLNELP